MMSCHSIRPAPNSPPPNRPQVGCPSCGFSFCSACVKRSISVPQRGNRSLKVCPTCYDRLSRQQNAETAASSSPAVTIDAILTTADTSANDLLPAPAPLIIQPVHPDDDAIRTRLQQLKDERLATTTPVAVTTDADIAQRVAQLKGERYVDPRPAGGDPAVLLATDTRSDQQKASDLMRRYAAEARLDEAADPIRDIERRLAALRDGAATSSSAAAAAASTATSGSSAPGADDDDDDDDTKVRQLVARFMDEAALERRADADELELTAEELAFIADVKPPAPRRPAAANDPTAAAASSDEDDKSSRTASDSETDNNADRYCYICDDDEALRPFRRRLICKLCYDSKLYRDDD